MRLIREVSRIIVGKFWNLFQQCKIKQCSSLYKISYRLQINERYDIMVDVISNHTVILQH